MAVGGKTGHPDNLVLLDGLRGLGAILVVIGHTKASWGPFSAPSGAVIVDLFFLLSGFVISFSYEPKFAAGMGAGEFMIHRIVRLYPLYLAGIVFGFGVQAVMAMGDGDQGVRTAEATQQLALHLLVLPAPGEPHHMIYPLNAPAWTLFFELLVNLVYVLAFRWLRNTRVLIVVTLMCAAGLAATVFHFGRIDVGWQWQTFWGGFARAGFGFFAGVLAYRLLGSPRTVERPVRHWPVLLLVFAPLTCLTPATPELRPFVDLVFTVILGIPLLMFAQSSAPPVKYRALFATGGRLSYALYIIHLPLQVMMERIGWRFPGIYGLTPLPGIAILVVAVTLAYVLEKYYDRPVRRWIAAQMHARKLGRMEGEAAKVFAE
jgi:peptidoglycan/LPS O-acetylase OafA/YrhL